MAEFDVFIGGAGPAGAAAAITLARAGYAVCAADRARPGEFKIGESLAPAVKPLLRDLGALSACDGCRALVSYGNQSAWGSPDLADTDFIRDPHGHGFHVDRAAFDGELRAVARRAGALVLEDTCIQRMERISGRWQVVLENSGGLQTHKARWMLDCSGRSSVFARAQGAKPTVYNRLAAVIAIFESPDDSDRDSRTLVESAPDGWWYTSLVPGRRRIVVFHTDAPQVRQPEEFLAMMATTRHVVKRIEENGYRLSGGLRSAAANTLLLTPACGDGWFAAGDAAAAFDPLGSQGILTALYSGLKAAQALDESAKGSADAATRYERALRDVMDAHLRNRDLYYGYETRWPDHPFWARLR